MKGVTEDLYEKIFSGQGERANWISIIRSFASLMIKKLVRLVLMASRITRNT